MQERRAQYIQEGMDACTSKPISPKDLFEIIYSTIDESVDEGLDAEKTPGEEPQSTAHVTFDQAEVLERCGGDTELMMQLVNIFRSDCPNYLARAREAFTSGDKAAIGQAIHSFKGPLATLGFNSTLQKITALYDQCQRDDSPPSDDMLIALESDMERITALLDEIAAGRDA